jgi:hypothetical protein
MLIPVSQSLSLDRQSLAPSEGSLSFDCFCFEIKHITLRHWKPQNDLPADFVFGPCQSDVAQLNYVNDRVNRDVDRIDRWSHISRIAGVRARE